MESGLVGLTYGVLSWSLFVDCTGNVTTTPKVLTRSVGVKIGVIVK